MAISASGRTGFSRRSRGGDRVIRLLRSNWSTIASFFTVQWSLNRGLSSTMNPDIVVDNSRHLRCLSSLSLNWLRSNSHTFNLHYQTALQQYLFGHKFAYS